MVQKDKKHRRTLSDEVPASTDEPLMLTYPADRSAMGDVTSLNNGAVATGKVPSSSLRSSAGSAETDLTGFDILSTLGDEQSWGIFDKKSSTNYVGLSNQGATCYMNSLLQTLYMTPEFRRALYEWSYSEEKEGPAEECIPLQLQRLFAYLQASERAYIETKDLTKSFGWSSGDAFEPHDIQELNRVLFDALERSFRGMPAQTLFQDLYQGKMMDQIVCQECKSVTGREDSFLDLPLVIRDASSLHEALDKFVEKETLDGDNMYNCSTCDKRVVAQKGFKLTEIPYLLTLQLKRFDIDYETFDRVKLNNVVTFPRYLNMDQYIKAQDPSDQKKAEENKAPEPAPEEPQAQPEEAQAQAQPEDEKKDPVADEGEKAKETAEEKYDSAFMSDDEFIANLIANHPALSEGSSSSSSSSSSGADSQDEPPESSPIPEGDQIFELYSILIHSGGAYGGHYYAFIKNFEDQIWYKFNDANVTRVRRGEIEESFGSSDKKKSQSANAYMLVYRKLNDGNNLKNLPNDKIPAALLAEIEQDNINVRKKREEYLRVKDLLNITIYYKDRKEMLVIDKKVTLEDATREAFQMFELYQAQENQAPIALEDVRLRLFDSIKKVPGNDFGNQLQRPLKDIGISYSRTLLLETREPNTEWFKWNINQLYLFVSFWNDEETRFDDPIPVITTRGARLNEFKVQIESLSNIPADQIRIFKYGFRVEELKDESLTMGPGHRLEDGGKVYVEKRRGIIENGVEISFIEGHFNQIRDSITLHYNMPGSEVYDQLISADKKMTLEKLRETLSPIIGLGVDEFKIKKRSVTMYELREVAYSLQDHQLYNDCTIHIEKGIPLRSDEYNVKFSKFNNATNTTEFLFEQSICIEKTVAEIKEQISERVGISPKLMRFRDLFGNRLAKIYKNTVSLRKSVYGQFLDGKSIVIQEIDKEEDIKENQIVVLLGEYNPTTNLLSTKGELVIAKESTILALQATISEASGIPEEHQAIAKLLHGQRLSNVDPTDLSWKQPLPPADEGRSLLSRYCWYPCDGDYFVCRDLRLEAQPKPKETTDGTADSSSDDSKKDDDKKPSKISYTSFRRPEKALKIKTRFDDPLPETTEPEAGVEVKRKGLSNSQ
eukprot:TRINITY_DN552_c0_g1_i1.p1 TRINITY_DN552_c0_g1~~TRINITY_DN552_c0_g1_i1.p1  ORF type:complete len:1117 (+),score=586.54 TRINITY_DN552_c0_g1_i1:123-3473(+)